MTLVKEHKTHIAQVRDKQFNQMGHVCELLGITREGYCWHQYKQYEKFLALACMDKTGFLEPLRYSQHFRGFWNNEWAARNQVEFFPFAYETKYDRKEIMAEYLYIHNHERLFTDECFYKRFESILKFI